MAGAKGQSTDIATKPGRSDQARQRLVIPFEDNRLFAQLVGEFDSHLALIEDRLGVEAVAHGNVVTVTGTDTRCVIARDVLERLYRRLERGESVTAGDVDGAIRLANGLAVDRPNDRRPARARAAASGDAPQIRTRKRIITARTPMQGRYIEAMKRSDLVFGTGPAGTGKTYLAVAFAAACLESGQTEKIILSRPAVEAGERLGFLPGDMKDKVDPYLRPAL